MSDMKIPEPIVAKFDFGANGNIELTPSRLLASLKGETTIASVAGTKTGVNEEMRVKLEQLKNFGIMPPKTWIEFLPLIAPFYTIPLVLPMMGLLFGSMSGALTFGFGLGFFAYILVVIWMIRKPPMMLKMILKKCRCAYLIFSSPNGSTVCIPFEVSRMPDVEVFAQTVKKTQSVYVDSI